METNEFYSTLLNDAWTVYMTFCGILISIITLLYSVILGKRSELEVYAEQAKLGHSDPLMRRRRQITVKVIKKMVSINKWVFAILCISLFNSTLSWLSFRFLPQEYMAKTEHSHPLEDHAGQPRPWRGGAHRRLRPVL